MPIQSTDTTSAINFTADVQTWVVEANVTVAVSGGGNTAVITTYDYSTLLNHGNLSAASAVFLFGIYGLFVNATDGYVIAANNGVESYGSANDIVNHGEIDGRRVGVVLAGAANQLSNDGQIYGGDKGVVLGASGFLYNAGSIGSGGACVQLGFSPASAGLTETVQNVGTLQGGVTSFTVAIGGTALDLDNSGLVIGSVDLQTGAASTIVNSGAIRGDVVFGSLNECSGR